MLSNAKIEQTPPREAAPLAQRPLASATPTPHWFSGLTEMVDAISAERVALTLTMELAAHEPAMDDSQGGYLCSECAGSPLFPCPRFLSLTQTMGIPTSTSRELLAWAAANNVQLPPVLTECFD